MNTIKLTVNFTPDEKKLLMETLILFVDAGHELEEKDAYELLGRHLNMRLQYFKIYNPEPTDIPTWCHASLLDANGLGWLLTDPMHAARLYNPTYEGEYYFTPRPADERQCVKTHINHTLVCLQTPDSVFRTAIQTQKELSIKTLNATDSALRITRQALCSQIQQLSLSECLKKTLMDYLADTPAFFTKNMSLKEAHDYIQSCKIEPLQKAKQLLLLCETKQRILSLTDEHISLLLNIYYDIYCLLNTLHPSPDYQAVIFDYFTDLKLLLTFEKPSPKHNEIIYLLLCGAFQDSFNTAELIMGKSITELRNLHFNEAIRWYLETNEFMQYAWANDLRCSILKFVLFSNHKDFTPKNILTLIAEGDTLADGWQFRPMNTILPIAHRQNIRYAISYYSIVIWLKNVGLFPDILLREDADVANRIQILEKHLRQSEKEEYLLLMEPLIHYNLDQNPRNSTLIALHLERDFQAKVNICQIEILFNTKVPKSRAEFEFLIEVCNDAARAYPDEVRGIILLNLSYKIYDYIKCPKKMDIKQYISSAEKAIQCLPECNNRASLLYEILNILLFQLGLLKHKNLMLASMSNVPQYFLNAISSNAAFSFKSKWANALRCDAFISYAKHFSFIPELSSRNDIHSMFEYIKTIEMLSDTADGKHVQEATNILSWALTVKLYSPTKEPTLPKKPKPSIQELNSEPTEKLEEAKKKQAREQAAELARQRQLAKQERKKKNRQEAQVLKKETEAKEALERFEREKEEQQQKEALIEARKQRALEKAREETLEKEKRDQLKAAKKMASAAAKAIENAKKLEALEKTQQEQALLEKKRADEQLQIVLDALKKENHIQAHSKELCIAERPLRALCDFSLDTFSSTEMSEDNLHTLKAIDTTLNKLGDLELFGSYVVFLANLRLAKPTKRPCDLDLRIKLKENSLEEYAKLIRCLMSQGFNLLNLDQTQDASPIYINAQMITNGYLSLSKPALFNNEHSKKIELSILFPNYRPNTEPFDLLKHFITIQCNMASFNGGNLTLVKQLANDILNNVFNCTIQRTMSLEFNVYNFFCRAIQYKYTWGQFYNMKTGSMHDCTSQLPLIEAFFSIRFCAPNHKKAWRKNVYLEIASLISESYFIFPESTLILKGFLNAFLKILNEEYTAQTKEHFVESANISDSSKAITQELQKDYLKNLTLYNGANDKKEICQIFYKQLIHFLGIQNSSKPKHEFLVSNTKNPNSILFDIFEAFKIKECLPVQQIPVPVPAPYWVPMAFPVMVPIPSRAPYPPPPIAYAYAYNRNMLPRQPYVVLPNRRSQVLWPNVNPRLSYFV